MRNRISLFIVLLILINMITLSTMHVPKRGDIQEEAKVEYTVNDGKYGYFVYGIWFPLFENGVVRSRGQLSFSSESRCTYMMFPDTICRIKDRWSELLFT